MACIIEESKLFRTMKTLYAWFVFFKVFNNLVGIILVYEIQTVVLTFPSDNNARHCCIGQQGSWLLASESKHPAAPLNLNWSVAN